MKAKLKLAFFLYSDHLVWELLLIIQIVIFLFCSSLLVSNYVQQQQKYDAFAKVFTDECIYFQPYDRLVELFCETGADSEFCENARNQISNSIQHYAPDAEEGTIISTYCGIDGQLFKVLGYNIVMMNYMGLSEKLNAFIQDDPDIIPVLVQGPASSQFNIGDRLSILLGDESYPVSMMIAGKLNRGVQLIQPSYGGNYPSIDYFLTSGKDNTLVFCYSEDSNRFEQLIHPARFIFVKKGSNSSQELLHVKSDGGKYYRINELVQNTMNINTYVNRIPLSKTFAAFIFTMVSLLGYVFLLFIRNRKFLGICTILGLSRKNMLMSIFLAIGYCFIGSVLLYATISYIGIQNNVISMTDSSVLLYSVLSVLLSFFMGTLICGFLILRWQPVHYLGKE